MVSSRKLLSAVTAAFLVLQTVAVAQAAAPGIRPGQVPISRGPQMMAPSPAAAAQMAQLRSAAQTPKPAQVDAKAPEAGPIKVGGSVAATTPAPDQLVRVIVEMNGSSLAQQVSASGSTLQKTSPAMATATATQNQRERDQVVSTAVNSGISMKVRHTYNTVLKGFSAEVRYRDIARLQTLPGVAKVTLAKEVKPDDNYSTQLIGAPNLWDADPSLQGEGMVAAIIDTGIDYRHSELGASAAMGPDQKVIGGHNWADNNDQVIDFSGSGHGVHVSGIVAATGDGELHVKGVAPKAQLIAEKVFSNNPDTPSAYTDDLVAAIDDAVDINSPYHNGVVANALNMSLGAVSGFTDVDDPEIAAVHNATVAGAVVSISAGNSSYSTSAIYNPYYRNQDIQAVGSPGTAIDAITVASSLNSYTTVSGRELVATIDGAPYTGAHKVFVDGSGKHGAFQTLSNQEFAVAVPSGSNIGCNASDWNGVNLTGKVALIKRGSCTFQVKTDNAAAAHAAAVIVYTQNPDPEILTMAVDTATIPSVMIMNSFGTDLATAIAAGKAVKVSFNGSPYTAQFKDPAADTMASSSSWGTTPDLRLKPDLTAPGQNIWSTVPNNQYELMSGTSMAAPHVTGASLLVKEAHPDYTPADIKAALMNTATILKPSATANPYSPRQQGAGRIQVDKAVTTNVLVTTGTDNYPSISLGAIAKKSVTPFTLHLQNRGTTDASFNLAGSVYRPGYSGGFNTLGSTVLTGAAVTFKNSTVTVPAGQTVDVTGALDLSAVPALSIDAPYGYFAEGFIKLTSSVADQPNLVVPYMSYVGNWGGQLAAPIVDPMNDDPWCYDCRTGLYYPGSEPGRFFQLGWGYDDSFSPANAAISNDPATGSDQTSVWPLLVFLRNARTMNITVLDSNNNQVDKIAADDYIRNLGAARYYLGYWSWDGTRYNTATGGRTPVAEGQYKVRVTSTTPGTWGGAQTFDMPVTVDNTMPYFEIASKLPSAVGTGPGTFPISIAKAADPKAANGADGSGLYGLYTILDGEVSGPYAPTSTTLNVQLTPGTHNELLVCAMDNAGVIGCAGTKSQFLVQDITVVGKTDIQTTAPWVDLHTTISSNVAEVKYAVGASAEVSNGKSGDIHFNLAKDGAYVVKVNAYDAKAKLLGSVVYNIDLDMTPPMITVLTPDPKRPVLESRHVDVTGNVWDAHMVAGGGVTYTYPTKDGDVTPQPLVLDDKGNFAFAIDFDSDGRKDIKFHGEDALGNVVDLSRVIAIGKTAPVVTSVFDPAGDQPAVTVNVSNPGTFTLTGTTADAVLGYTFYVNGSPEYYVDDQLAAKAKSWSYNVGLVGNTDPVIVTMAAANRAGSTTSHAISFVPAVAPLVTVDKYVIDAAGATTVTISADPSVTGITVNGQDVALVDGVAAMSMAHATAVTVIARTADPTVFGMDFAAPHPALTVTSPVKDSWNKAAHFEGTVSVGASVTVDGNAATVNANGTWSYDLNSAAEGANTVDVVATAADGSQVTVATSFNIDSVDPVVTLNAPAELQKDSVTVTGTAADANLVAVTLNGEPVTVAEDGTFTATFTPDTDSTFDIDLVATDKAGNVGESTKSVSVDVNAPTISFTAPSNWVSSGAFTVEGTVADVNIDTATFNGDPLTLNADGTFTVDLKDVADGKTTYTIVAQDKVGHETTKSLDVNVDTVAPVLAITSPADNVVSDWAFTVTGTVADANLSTLTVNDQTVTVTAGKFSAPITYTSAGTKTVTVVATDLAGNKTTATVNVILSAGLKSLALNPAGSWSPNSGALSIKFDMVSAQAAKVDVLDGTNKLLRTLFNSTASAGVNTVTWDGTVAGSRVADGSYSIRVTVGTTVITEAITVNTKGPDLKLDTVTSPTNSRNVTISGGATGTTKVNITVSGPSYVPAFNGLLADGSGNFAKAFTLPTTNGTYTFTVVAFDAQNNPSAPATLKVVLDTVVAKPVLTTTTVPTRTNADTFTALFQAGELGTLNATVLKGTDVVIPAFTADVTTLATKTSLPVDISKLADGTYTLSVTFTDKAGNTSGAVTATFIVDRTAPTLTVTTANLTAGEGNTLTGSANSGSVFTFKFTVSEASTVRLQVNTTVLTLSPSSGVYTVSRTVLAGTNTFTVTLTDATGNKTVYTVTITGK